MSKEEFFEQLRNELGFLPENKVEAAIKRYETYFSCSDNIENTIESIGGVQGAARTFLRKTPHDRPDKQSTQPFPIWAALICAIVLIPIAVPLASVFITIAGGIATFVIGAVIAATIGSIAAWLGGAGMILSAFPAEVIIGDKLMQIGCGFMLFGLGIIFMVLMYMFYTKAVPKLLRKIAPIAKKLLGRCKS